MGFEPTTTCLGSKDSTTELRPLAVFLLRCNSSTRQQMDRCYLSARVSKQFISFATRNIGTQIQNSHRNAPLLYRNRHRVSSEDSFRCSKQKPWQPQH